ncbi:MAG TPA: 16S rRNA (adenine(1518)-N(6)/adenine(1519)-N(6))-dimethyltransferase RsmA [Rhizomicrobium sp.]|jgi:16S rRNA (adenine1518-N6/adenine1519-N6)-dimethyltransferase
MREVSDGLPPLRNVIAAYGLAAKKSFGQNFLLDFNLTRKIARSAGPLENVVVYEVGPGPGGLTRALLSEGAARVIAVERDKRCLPALDDIARVWPGRLQIVDGDALALDEISMLRQHDAASPVRVMANLPYNIATALLVKWLTVAEWPPFWDSLTLMFQREVAQRFVALAGSSDYGRLSVLSQWRTRPRIVFDVDRRAFTPSPKITSTLVRFEPMRSPIAPARLDDLQTVTAAAFGMRRKMLRQSLKSIAPKAEEMILAAGLDPRARAQDLDIHAFAALARLRRAALEGSDTSCESRSVP